MSRTGQTSSLMIDSLTSDRCSGVIGMSCCPGRNISYAIGGDWDRDLDADIKAIRAWGANAVVSLMEEDEMAYYGVADIPAKTIQLGMTHYHLPIVDMHIPDERFEAQWQSTGESLRNALISGESIVIHCLGGFGRTGTIAGRLLVELGSDPETAILQVRRARPGTIQTIMQECYVLGCKQADINQPDER